MDDNMDSEKSEFYNILTQMLAHQQMSISRIARELKKSGYDQHRLILTGYLRALHDIGRLEEINIPPSKVYALKSKIQHNIYTILKEHLKNTDPPEKLEVAVFILTSLFQRPCFKYELELLGIPAQKTSKVLESKDTRLAEHLQAVTRIKIPHDDPAFEISDSEDKSELLLHVNKVLIALVNELIDLDGL